MVASKENLKSKNGLIKRNFAYKCYKHLNLRLVLYGCKTFSVVLVEERKWAVLTTKCPGKELGQKRGCNVRNVHRTSQSVLFSY